MKGPGIHETYPIPKLADNLTVFLQEKIERLNAWPWFFLNCIKTV
jgi:hypothetical protein